MKSLINPALLKEQLKRYWPIAAAAMLAYMLLIIWPIYISTDIHPSNIRTAHQMKSLLMGGNLSFMFATILVPLCMALTLFSYPYKTALATAFHSFPVSKKQLFFTHGFAGFLLMLVPLVILSLVMLIPVRQAGEAGAVVYHWMYISFERTATIGIPVGQSVNPPGLVVGFFFRGLLGFMFNFALFTLAASVAGNRFVAGLAAFAFAILPVALVGLGQTIASLYVFGFGHLSRGAVLSAGVFTQPALWASGGETHFPPDGLNVAAMTISYFVIMLAAFGLAYMAFGARRLERAGEPVVFTPVKRVLVFLFAMSGMVLFGSFVFSSVGLRVGLYVGFVAGFIIAYFAAQMVAERTFRVGHKAKYLLTYGAIALGLYVLVLLVTGVGLRGYERRIPQPQDIVGVHIDGSLTWIYQMRDRDAWLDAFIDDPTTIARTLEIHRDILDQRRDITRLMRNPRQQDPWYLGLFTVDYMLAGGRVMSRTYFIPREMFSDLDIHGLRGSFPVRLARYAALRNPEDIQFIEVAFALSEDVWEEASALGEASTEALNEGLIDLFDELNRERWRLEDTRNRATISDRTDITTLAQAIIYDLRYISESDAWTDERVRSGNHMEVFIQPQPGIAINTLFLHVPMDGYVARWVMDNMGLTHIGE